MNEAKRNELSGAGEAGANLTGLLCADCGSVVGHDNGPVDGWQLEDGRTVCHSCCVEDFGIFVKHIVGSK